MNAVIAFAARHGPGQLPFVVALMLGVVLVTIVLVGGRHRRDIHRRGTRIEDGRRAQRRARRQAHRPIVTIAGVELAPLDETKHFKVIGTTGTGKSTVIREMLAGVLRRCDRAVIADPGCGYLRHFQDPSRGDVILNPFERGAVKWDPFAEITGPADPEQLAASLIAPAEDAASREWRGYARTFLASLLRGTRERGGDVAQLWRLIAVAPSAQLRPLVWDTPAQPFLEPENARMFGSIRSVAANCTAGLEHVRAQRARSFSVRRWIREGRGILFLPYRPGQIAALRTLVSSWLRLAIFETMEGPAQDRRLWFVIDELDALGAIDGLRDALARLRKFGGRCVLGMQSVAQVSSLYGVGDAQTIIENCGNTLVLRCSASERGGTAQFCSRLIGEREVTRRTLSRSRDRSGGFGRAARRSLQVGEQRVVETAVLPSEIEQLADLEGFLKIATSSRWLKVRLSRPD